jgi:hypothetical protein
VAKCLHSAVQSTSGKVLGELSATQSWVARRISIDKSKPSQLINMWVVQKPRSQSQVTVIELPRLNRGCFNTHEDRVLLREAARIENETRTPQPCGIRSPFPRMLLH